MRASVAVAVIVATAVGAGAASATPRLVDVSRQAGIFDMTHTWSADGGDFNGDGREDLIVVNHYQKRAYLYRNDPKGRYARVRAGRGTFKKRDRHHCAFGDVDRDGLTDIYCTIGGGRGSGRSPKELWMQRPGGGFVDRANEYGVVDRNGRGRDTTFIDANRDGLLDLFVGNKYPRTDRRKSRNKLYINVDGTRFRNARDYGVTRQVGGRSVESVDYNGDGFDDLFVCGERHAFLYRNVHGNRFKNVSRRANVDFPCESALMARFSGDARPDIAIVTKTRLKLLLQRRNGTFRRSSKRRLEGGTEIAAGSVNGDSLADLYVVQSGKPDADEPDLMLLNRRGGRGFKNIRIPQTRRGKGDYVTSLDFDQNGRTDFLVMNGSHKSRGPVRLLVTRR